MTTKVNFDDFLKEVLATPGGQTAYDIADALCEVFPVQKTITFYE